MTTSGIPLSPEAEELFKLISPQIEKELNSIERIPIAVLVWGPAPTSGSPYAKIRIELRDELIQKGHLARFSEELYNTTSSSPPRIQQIAQAKYFEIIVSIPESHGSVAEIHDFIGNDLIKQKILVFINEEFDDGYSNKSIRIFDTVTGCRIHSYCGLKEISTIKETVFKEMHNYQLLKYMKQSNMGGI